MNENHQVSKEEKLQDSKKVCVCAKLLQSCQSAKLLCPGDSPGKNYWSGLLCPPSGDLPDPEIKTVSLTSPALAGGGSLW